MTQQPLIPLEFDDICPHVELNIRVSHELAQDATIPELSQLIGNAAATKVAAIVVPDP